MHESEYRNSPIKIESRGIPPYKISNGNQLFKAGNKLISDEQFSSAQTFEDAFWVIYDLTDGGNNKYGQYIQDSKNDKVFTVDNPVDVKILLSIDKSLYPTEFN